MMDKSDEYFIICASPDYINAINMDLMKGISYLKDVDRQLIIISSSQAKFSLKKNLLVSNKSIAEFFNSNMLMLNIKIAQYVIEQFMSMDDGHLGLLAERLRSTFSVLPKKAYCSRGAQETRRGNYLDFFVYTCKSRWKCFPGTSVIS